MTEKNIHRRWRIDEKQGLFRENTGTCVACGAVEPTGGLRLGTNGGGAEYEWFCKRVKDCAERIAANIRGGKNEEADSHE